MKKWLFAGACAVAVAGVAIKLYFDREIASEIALLREVLELKPGMTIADVGAGKGTFTFAAARAVGPRGRVLSTEADPDRIADIQRALGRSNNANVTVLKGSVSNTG